MDLCFSRICTDAYQAISLHTSKNLLLFNKNMYGTTYGASKYDILSKYCQLNSKLRLQHTVRNKQGLDPDVSQEYVLCLPAKLKNECIRDRNIGSWPKIKNK
jgi:hypothetical protein